MPICPSCKTEFQDGADACPECGAALISTPAGDEEEVNIEFCENPVFFKSVANDIEANILKSLLNSYGIPVMKKYSEAGTTLILYAGSTNFGVDLFVPEDKLSLATDIATAQTDLTDEEILIDYGSPEEEAPDSPAFNRSFQIVVAILVILVAFVVFIPLIKLFFK